MAILKWIAIGSFMCLEVIVVLYVMREPAEKAIMIPPTVMETQAIDDDIWSDNDDELAIIFRPFNDRR